VELQDALRATPRAATVEPRACDPARRANSPDREVNVQSDVVDRVRQNPKFQELVKTRTSFGWQLTIVMLAIYYGFILVVAFKKEWLAVKLGAGVMTVGIPVGVAVILSAFILTGIYVARANRDYDALIAAIKEDAAK
jgi:uncharacterized membrane protein (DUF485 family)